MPQSPNHRAAACTAPASFIVTAMHRSQPARLIALPGSRFPLPLPVGRPFALLETLAMLGFISGALPTRLLIAPRPPLRGSRLSEVRNGPKQRRFFISEEENRLNNASGSK